jgi:hypothetical protein
MTTELNNRHHEVIQHHRDSGWTRASILRADNAALLKRVTAGMLPPMSERTYPYFAMAHNLVGSYAVFVVAAGQCVPCAVAPHEQDERRPPAPALVTINEMELTPWLPIGNLEECCHSNAPECFVFDRGAYVLNAATTASVMLLDDQDPTENEPDLCGSVAVYCIGDATPYLPTLNRQMAIAAGLTPTN